MNEKPNLPEELLSGKGYARIVNIWSWVGTFIAVASQALLHYQKDWHIALRAFVALVPLVPALFWLRSYARWVRGMDELHRRIELAACLFATTTTLFLFMTLHPLAKAGVFRELGFHEWWLLDWHSWLLTIWLMVCFYYLGYAIFNRRFK